MKNLITHSLILVFILYFGFAPTFEAKTLSYRNAQNRTVVLLKMSAKFQISDNGKTNTLKLEDTDVVVSGNISNNASLPYEIITFIASWNGTNYQFILTFNSSQANWTWKNSTFVVMKTILPLEKMISSFGDGTITTKANHSYVCTSPLDFTTPNKVGGITVSVTWNQFQVEVYPTNNTLFDQATKPCTVDLDDKIVPIAVGGALGLLLLLVVIIYVISYIRDRRQQSKELRSGYNRIDQPEPNHHS